MNSRKNRGFTLVELLVSMAVALIVLTAAATAFKKSMDATLLVTQRAEMQANARTAINFIVRDLGDAGAGGFPNGGISLPTGNVPFFARDVAGTNYLLNNTYTQNRLFAVTPDPNGGPTLSGLAINGAAGPAGAATDGITLVYVDQATTPWNLNPTTTINAAGTSVTLNAAINPAWNDPVLGLRVGDLLMLSNQNGTAVGEVTGLPGGGVVTFANADPLAMNKSGPGVAGSISALANGGGGYPPTSVVRIFMISYFVQCLDANGNAIAVPPGAAIATDARLMRQVNAQAPVPVAEHVVNMKFSYDLVDPVTNVATSASPDAAPGGTKAYNQIRNIYVSVTTRSARPVVRGLYSTSTMFTNISPRNLSFRNRYS